VSADEPAALVDAALRRMNEGWPQPSDSEARELDVVRVMLDGSDDLRRACVLELAERSTDTSASWPSSSCVAPGRGPFSGVSRESSTPPRRSWT
jgi:hypothetical protein